MALSEKEVTHLAELARIALSPSEKKALLKDLEKILAHVDELKTVDTDGVAPMVGGSHDVNMVREDVARGAPQASSGVEATPVLSGAEAFPETQSGFLKIPPVFKK